MVAEPDLLTKRGKAPPPALKINVIHCDQPNDQEQITQSTSNINLSVCIKDAPPSPTQHAEFTLALTPSTLSRRFRHRKQAVTDIHACFDISDVNGNITVVDDVEVNNNTTEEPETEDKHCQRYERDSIDLLERYEEIHPDQARELDDLAHLTSPNHKISHHIRFNLLEHCCIRSAKVQIFSSNSFYFFLAVHFEGNIPLMHESHKNQ